MSACAECSKQKQPGDQWFSWRPYVFCKRKCLGKFADPIKEREEAEEVERAKRDKFRKPDGGGAY